MEPLEVNLSKSCRYFQPYSFEGLILYETNILLSRPDSGRVILRNYETTILVRQSSVPMISRGWMSNLELSAKEIL
jgi:hypothetical protein